MLDVCACLSVNREMCLQKDVEHKAMQLEFRAIVCLLACFAMGSLSDLGLTI